MLVQARIKCLLKWFTDDKNDFHLSLDNIFYFILSAFLTDSKELCVLWMCNYNFIDIRDIYPFHLNALKGKVCAHICSRSLLSNGKEKQRVQGSKIFIFLSVVSVFHSFPFFSFYLSVCCLGFCLSIYPSFLSICPSLSLSSYLSKTERRTDSYSDTGLCSCPQEGITWWSS